MCLFFLHAKTQTKLLNECQKSVALFIDFMRSPFLDFLSNLEKFSWFFTYCWNQNDTTQHKTHKVRKSILIFMKSNWNKRYLFKTEKLPITKIYTLILLPDTFPGVSIYKSYCQKILEILNGCILSILAW